MLAGTVVVSWMLSSMLEASAPGGISIVSTASGELSEPPSGPMSLLATSGPGINEGSASSHAVSGSNTIEARTARRTDQSYHAPRRAAASAARGGERRHRVTHVLQSAALAGAAALADRAAAAGAVALAGFAAAVGFMNFRVMRSLSPMAS